MGYSEVDLTVSPELRASVSAVSGMRTVPQIFIGGSCVGGADALDALIKEDKACPLATDPCHYQSASLPLRPSLSPADASTAVLCS